MPTRSVFHSRIPPATERERAKWRAERTSRLHNIALVVLNVAAMVISMVGLEMAYDPPANPLLPGTCDGGGSYNRAVTTPLCMANLAVTACSWLILIRYYSFKYSAKWTWDFTSSQEEYGGQLFSWRNFSSVGRLPSLLQ